MTTESDEIIRRIWAAFPSRKKLPFKCVEFSDGTLPQPHRCQVNASRLARENSDIELVPAWLATGILLQKHWIVRDQTGLLFDITPLVSSTPVFEHPGSVAEFIGLAEEIHLVLFQHLRDVAVSTLRPDD